MENKIIFWTLGVFEWLFFISYMITDSDLAFTGTLIFGAAAMIAFGNRKAIQ